MTMVSSQIGKEWKKLGRQLGLTDGELETLKMNFLVDGQEEIVYQMISKWNSVCAPTTLAQLAKACVTVGRGDVADLISEL